MKSVAGGGVLARACSLTFTDLSVDKRIDKMMGRIKRQTPRAGRA